MKKAYRNALRKRFTKALARAAPEWAPTTVRSIHVGPGETLFRRDVPGLALWIVLVPDAKGRDAFTVELGWSVHGRFPEVGMRPSAHPSAARTELADDEGTVRLPGLWSNVDPWWTVWDPLDATLADPMAAVARMAERPSAQEADAEIAPLVDGAVARLVELGPPYLEERAARGRGPRP